MYICILSETREVHRLSTCDAISGCQQRNPSLRSNRIWCPKMRVPVPVLVTAVNALSHYFVEQVVEILFHDYSIFILFLGYQEIPFTTIAFGREGQTY